MKFQHTLALALITWTYSQLSQATTLASESFDSGALQTSSTTGFKWTDSTYSTIMGGLGRSATSGLRFYYYPGNFIAEQRFDTTVPRKDIWINYWVRVPSNYKHITAQPSNCKLFALWMDDYSANGDGPTVIWEFWSDGNGGSQLAVHYSSGGHNVTGEHMQLKPFISYPADQGRWMQIALHAKAATARGSEDGIIQLYRRWDGEASYTQLHDIKNADIAAPPGGPSGWQRGYLMGWSNPGYADVTEWVVDDFQITDTSPLTNVSNIHPDKPKMTPTTLISN